ncbi:DUF4168 domain-containing protein [Nodosilinea sp. P-1105]|uniref:DUF4168 domain-containing protein n=1 Tax=Nodosilinea sp. P-1105 TaxID=2546229 RepID=UPI00146E298E|nr:DUF4168 domain-containing protein [Nodosilinea sp. P-1105]NMF83334.1 DUF4168 domain-containing protein [Nodosilinea sp. P-1105]
MKPSTLLRGVLAATLVIAAPAAAVAQQPETAPQPEMAPQPTPEPQVELSPAQIDSFVNAYQAIQMIQQEVQADLVAAVEAEGLSVDDYNAIAESQQSPEAAAEIPAEQTEQFAAAVEQVSTIRASARDDMEAAIQAQDLTIEEFEQILTQAQQDPALQQEINQRLGGQ